MGGKLGVCLENNFIKILKGCDVGIAPYDEVQKSKILQKCGKRTFRRGRCLHRPKLRRKFLGAPTVKPKNLQKKYNFSPKNFTSYKTVRFESRFVRQFYGDTFLLSDILTSEN